MTPPRGNYKTTPAKRAYQRQYNAKKRIERKALIDSLKDRPCEKCGVKYPPYVMDFHHRDPSAKLFSASQKYVRSEKQYLAEIAKCDLLCSNCHRMVEYGEV